MKALVVISVVITILISTCGCQPKRPETMKELLSIHHRAFSEEEDELLWQKLDTLDSITHPWMIMEDDTIFIWESSEPWSGMSLWTRNDTLTFSLSWKVDLSPQLSNSRIELISVHEALLSNWNTDSIRLLSKRLKEYCDTTYEFEEPYPTVFLSRFIVTENNLIHDTLSFSDLATRYFLEQLIVANDTSVQHNIRDPYANSLIRKIKDEREWIQKRRELRRKQK